MNFKLSVIAKSLLPAFFLPALSILPAEAGGETILTPLPETPYQSRLGDCLTSSAVPVLYGRQNFRGRILRISRSENRLSSGMNDLFSAACVPQGWAMTVYKKADFNGRSLTIGPGYATTRIRDELNNEISSVIIYKVHGNGSWEQM